MVRTSWATSVGERSNDLSAHISNVFLGRRDAVQMLIAKCPIKAIPFGAAFCSKLSCTCRWPPLCLNRIHLPSPISPLSPISKLRRHSRWPSRRSWWGKSSDAEVWTTPSCCLARLAWKDWIYVWWSLNQAWSFHPVKRIASNSSHLFAVNSKSTIFFAQTFSKHHVSSCASGCNAGAQWVQRKCTYSM